jgi:hypothetical protein
LEFEVELLSVSDLLVLMMMKMTMTMMRKFYMGGVEEEMGYLSYGLFCGEYVVFVRGCLVVGAIS